MKAAGFYGLKDADLPANAVAPDVGGPTLLGGLGYSLLGNGLLGFVSWMAVDDSNPAGKNRVVAWVPQSLAPTEAQAEELTLRLVNEAFIAAAKTELPTHYSLHASEHFKYSTTIKGGACDSKYAQCKAGAYKTVADLKGTKFDAVMAPEFLGGWPAFVKRQNKAFEWRASGSDDASLFAVGHHLLDIHGFEIALKASAQLPDWIYLYAVPFSITYQDGDTRKPLPYPVVFHQGKALYFVKPKPGAAVAAN